MKLGMDTVVSRWRVCVYELRLFYHASLSFPHRLEQLEAEVIHNFTWQCMVVLGILSPLGIRMHQGVKRSGNIRLLKFNFDTCTTPRFSQSIKNTLHVHGSSTVLDA